MANTDSSIQHVLQSAAMFRTIRFPFLSLLLTFLGLTTITPVRCQDLPNTVSLTAQQVDQLRELAGRILKHADKAGCKKNICRILVADFTGPSDSTSVLGMQLSDTLSSQLVALTNGTRIVYRGSLQSLLDREKIPAKLLEDYRAAAWLTHELSFFALLNGSLDREGSGVRLRVQLLNAEEAFKRGKDKKDKASIEELVLSIQDMNTALAPALPVARTAGTDTASSGEKVFRAGLNGTTMPKCYYHPDPQYTDVARSAEFTGTVLLEVTIMPDGRMADIRLVRGAPFGLNDSARDAVAKWECKPASSGGTPVPTRVPIEIAFRLRN